MGCLSTLAFGLAPLGIASRTLGFASARLVSLTIGFSQIQDTSERGSTTTTGITRLGRVVLLDYPSQLLTVGL